MSRAKDLTGLPDFGAFLGLPGSTVSVYPAHDEPGRFRTLGGEMRLARRRTADGMAAPDLTLELVRGTDPDRPPHPYGLLDLAFEGPVTPEADLDAALEAVRRRHPQAVFEPVAPVGGVLSLRVPGEQDGLRVTEAPAGAHRLAVHASGLGSLRFTHRLPLDTALVLRRALEQEVPGLHAVAALVFRGLAPRLPLTVRYRPAELVGALGDRPHHNDLVRLLSHELDALPLEVIRDETTGERPSLATALADHLTALHGRLTPDDEGADHHIHLTSDDEGESTLDLSLPRAVERARDLRFDPFAEARRLAASGSGEVVREITVPPLETGVVRFDVVANLPPRRLGAEVLAVRIEAPPRPPARIQKLSRTLTFGDSEDGRARQEVELRLAPHEPPVVQMTPQVMVADAGGRVQRLFGETRSTDVGREGDGATLTVSPEDFPVIFLSLTADRPLLETVLLDGVLHRDGTETPFTLTPQQPALSFVIPEDEAEDASLELEARDPEGDHAPVALGVWTARSRGLHLGLAALPGYGPQQVDIEVTFGTTEGTSGDGVLALDLQPAVGGEITTLAFTPTRPRRTWTYFSVSPFTPGYRYRPSAPPGDAELPWSPIQSVDATLLLSRDGSPRRQTMPDDSHPDTNPDTVDDSASGVHAGLRWWRDPSRPERIVVLPETPRPETDAQGHPTLSLLVAGESAFLQLTTRWDPAPAALEALEAHLDERFPEEAGTFLFTTAPVTVREAVLELLPETEDGEPTVLATSRSSGAPPYSALFNLRLDAEQTARAQAAIHGREGQLRVTYRATLGGGPGGTSERSEGFSSSSSRVRTVSRTRSSTTTSEGISDHAAEHTTEATREHAGAHAAADTPGAASPLSASTDIGRWFSGTGGDHVRTVGPSNPE